MHIINSVLGDARGGRWAVVCDYARLLAGRGHRVTLLLNRAHPPEAAEIPAAVETVFVRARGHYDYPAAWRLRRCWSKHPPALAIAHCSRSVALLKRALPRTPVLAVSHSNKVRRLLAADACLALTPHIREQFEQAGTGKPCFVVPNMIEVDAERPPAARRCGEPLRIGALGRFDPVKGFDVFLDALARIAAAGRDFQAVLGGAGPGRPALESRAAALGLAGRLRFTGWVDDVDAFLADLDILCVPARSDAFGLTPLQGARAGVPMVLSDATGHRAMFAAQHQVLFARAGDSEHLAHEIGRLMDDPVLAERLRLEAFRHLAANYSHQAVADRIIEVVDNTVNKIIL